jgi:8-oxo-dGTP pyrophosphatase MutT (NUDIX family)
MTALHLNDDDLRARLTTCLAPASTFATSPQRGDYDLNPSWRNTVPTERSLRPAAVLVPIVERKIGLHVIFTLRSEHLPAHAGQVSFPGGRAEPTDDDAVATALRETQEEIGLTRDFISIIGALDPYETGTGFAIKPVVAFVREGFDLRPNAAEVAAVFEVPLRFLMDPTNHERHMRVWQGRERHFYAMTFDGQYIWGATAGMLVNLYERLQCTGGAP